MLYSIKPTTYFVSWTLQIQDYGRSKSGIAQLKPQTGLATFFSETSIFDNNDQIFALQDGGFAVSLLCSCKFVETYDAAGNFPWKSCTPLERTPARDGRNGGQKCSCGFTQWRRWFANGNSESWHIADNNENQLANWKSLTNQIFFIPRMLFN